jgi:ATP-dependent RNA helicase DDX24/MAK5
MRRVGGFGSGFLDLEEIDEDDFGIFGSVLDDVGQGVEEAGKDHGKKNKKKKTKKRKRGGDDDGFSVDGALVVENEQVDSEKADEKAEDREKGEKKGKRKRNRKKRKVKDNETSRESDEDVASDNAEGDYTHLIVLSRHCTCKESLWYLSGYDMWYLALQN